MFGHDGIEDASIFKFGDQWQRGIKAAGYINEPLDVAQHDGKFCSLSNRRLTALMMFQSLHRDITVKAWCNIRSSDTQKFEDVPVINARKLGHTQQRAEENSTLNAYMVRRRRTGGVAGQDMELDAECIHGEL